MYLGLYSQLPAAAREALGRAKLDDIVGNDGYPRPRSFYEGLIARASGDAAGARTAFTKARGVLEAKLAGADDDALSVAKLAVLAAGQERKEEAIALGRRAVDLATNRKRRRRRRNGADQLGDDLRVVR